MYKLILLATFVIVQFNNVIGHGRLIEPASRNAMWRFKYKNPRNYNDMGLNCGGFTAQFEKNGGKCGVCGDPWTGEREHEAGGKYANGVIARQYKVGSFINVTVTLTSNHMGYFEFRLCPVNNPRVKATHACLDRHLLNIAGHGTRYFIMDKRGYVNIQMFVMLPPNLSCSQCVLQWKWVAGQSMGPDGHGGECLGCGNQENFVNCADIAIGDKVIAPLPQRVTTPSPPVTTTPQPSRYQVLPVAMMSNGAIPTVHASYGAYNVAPTSDVQYNIVPIPQPPTAHASHSTGHAHHVQSHGWPGNQFTPQPAQIVYKTIQETQPKPSNGRIKVQIIRKPNPYASMKTQNAQQHAHPAPQAPKSSGPSAQAYQQHGQHSNQATQTKHGYPQANSHLSHASGSVQHAGHMQPVSYVPHANTNVAPQANGFAQMSSHTSQQQQAYIQQVPTYPHQNAPAPQPPPPTYQQPNKHIQNAPQLQSQSYVPNIPQVQPVPQNVLQVQPLPQAKTNANVAPQGNIAMSAPMDFKSMKANLMKYFPNFAENLDWMNEFATPPNPTDPSQLSYPGYEPGEYPEPGESQQSSGSNGQSSSYMQGYNDAMQELKRQFGISDNSHQGGSSSAGTKCPGGAKPTCRGINQWEGQSQFDSWCTTTCTAGECPSNFCSCTCPGAGSSTWKSGLTCRGIDPAKGSSMDTWCTLNCKGGNCPSELCMCL